MKILYSFLSRFAESNGDGSFNILGGDFDNVQAENYPITIPLAIVMKAEIEKEFAEELPTVFSYSGPNGFSSEPMIFMLTADLVEIETNRPVGALKSRVVFNIGSVNLVEPGEYKFTITVGTGGKSDTATMLLNALQGKK